MIDPTLIPALDAIERALEGRAPRRYAPHPMADEPREEEPAHEPDAEQFFWEQQSPSERTFR